MEFGQAKDQSDFKYSSIRKMYLKYDVFLRLVLGIFQSDLLEFLAVEKAALAVLSPQSGLIKSYTTMYL